MRRDVGPGRGPTHQVTRGPFAASKRVRKRSRLASRRDERARDVRTAERRWEGPIEIGEAILLAVIAISTAWSGYQAAKLNDEASATFAQGTEARQHGDDFVRDTVLFASILMVVTLASRFHIRRVRLALLSVAGVLLVFALVSVIGLPRA